MEYVGKERVYGKNPRWFYFVNYGSEESPTHISLKDTQPTLSIVVDKIIESGEFCTLTEIRQISEGIEEVCGVEISNEELFDAAQTMLLAMNSTYGSSASVNVFYYDGNGLWIDKETRAGILARISAEEESGKDRTNLSIGSMRLLNLPIASVKSMLGKLEVYAAECFDNTDRHQRSIQGLESYEELCSYDYMGGYPTPLTFSDDIFTYVQSEPTPNEVMEALKRFALPTVVEQDDSTALENIELFPTWESMIGKEVKKDERYYYDKALWKVVQTHTAQNSWNPRVAASLFTQVVKGGADEGTLEDPIPFSLNMELVEGKYYLDSGVVYLCIESLNQCFWHLAAIPRYAQAVAPA